MSKTIYRDLKNATEDKIKDLLEESQGQITGSNYEALGELMDIHKDITNEEYWCYKMETFIKSGINRRCCGYYNRFNAINNFLWVLDKIKKEPFDSFFVHINPLFPHNGFMTYNTYRTVSVPALLQKKRKRA